ncbi:hypothetical protein [Pyxidicoccus xibeiensis]|uniref:hypothetical protein n=1 Tax=Pyxidicoccus xibeiensis TaxID=2906759 RepID=UPI0020A78FD1|nr:hypothetical protein [Pyxidicoccus xibeiensis]MCP3141644.1 hypothetical protein [Pyxidicoccus xibeiensis]
MGRVLTVILGLGAILAVAWYVTQRPVGVDSRAPAARSLENVRQAADSVEADLQKKADDLMKSRD